MPRSQADGKTRTVILTDEPVNPAAPTFAELNAGIYISCDIFDSDFTFGATDSDKFAEKAQCEVNNTNAFGASNFEAGITVFRDFGALGVPGPEDDVFTATKVKGTELWMYSRRTSLSSKTIFAATHEIYLGAKVITDEPQPPSERGGYIKWRVPMEVVEAYPWIAAAAGA